MMLRRAAIGLVLTGLASAAVAQSAPPAGPKAVALPPSAAVADEPGRQHGRWAQDYVGRDADPAVRFGQLPNGMRYAIMRNDTPKEAVSMRLLIDAGSLAEHDDERGIAHFLEHMAFRGSANVADGEVVRILERQGLSFGADTNAFTNFDRTMYQFNFPRSDASAVETGLMLLREIASRLKIDQAAVDAERGVILSEERLRASEGLAAFQARLAFVLPGTHVDDRLPIGTVDSLKAATAATIRRFYEANYRPEKATLVIVGAIDPDAIEADIRKRFGDWKAAAPADPPAPRALGTPASTAQTFARSGVSAALDISWTRPLDPRGDTLQRSKLRLARVLADAVLNLRLRDRGQAVDAPFSSAALQTSDTLDLGEVTSLGLQPAPGKWREALTAVIVEQRQMLRDGISPDDLKRVIGIIRPRLQALVEATNTRNSAGLANAIVNAVIGDLVFESPAQELAFFDKYAPEVTPEGAMEAFRAQFTGIGPLAFRTSADVNEGDDAALAATLKAAMTQPIAASSGHETVAWPYDNFGVPGRVTARTVTADGVTRVDFENGTRLAIKPTKFVTGGAQVLVSLGSGLIGIPPERARTRWLLDFGGSAWTWGGTGKLKGGALQRAVEAHNVGISLGVGDTSFILGGSTRRDDLLFQLQLLGAFVADPAFRPNGIERVRGSLQGQLSAIASNPTALFGSKIATLTHNGDVRWRPIPTPEDLAATSVDDLAPLLRDALASPRDVTIVGDVDVDAAIDAVAKTFGAMAPATLPRPGLARQHFGIVTDGPGPVTVLHQGRADKAIIAELWHTDDYFAAPADSQALTVAQAVLQGRLLDTVREKMGLTYAPFATANADADLPGEGFFMAGIEVPPAQFEQFRALLKREIEAIARTGVSADALERAKRPLLEARRKALETNGYWASRVERTLRDPRAEALYRDEISGLERVRAADVQRVLKRYVVGKAPVVIEVRADPKAAAAPAAQPAPTAK